MSSFKPPVLNVSITGSHSTPRFPGLDLGRTDALHQCHYPAHHSGFTHSQKTVFGDQSTFHLNITPGAPALQGVFRRK